MMQLRGFAEGGVVNGAGKDRGIVKRLEASPDRSPGLIIWRQMRRRRHPAERHAAFDVELLCVK